MMRINDNASIMGRIGQAKSIVERYTRSVPWWKALSSYPVVQTISKATHEQRAHDRKTAGRLPQ